ncbi:MAG TPA: DnaJ domain-containing protein [Candidatus Krumholzibacteria bacterium]|nr:DnaJ domain-containing protein [Candidatus Krumholzibacteria bacterium]
MVVDHYDVLGIEPTASTAEVRSAYFRLAKQLHPDRQVRSDPVATERFLAVQNAYEILVDPARREEHDRQRQGGDPTGEPAAAEGPAVVVPEASPAPVGRRGPTLEEARDARLAYQKALSLLENGDRSRALRTMAAVVRAVPDEPDYESMLGHLMALEGERLHRARDHCRRAVEAEPYNADFKARLGYVYLQAGLIATAQDCFDAALELDPRHPLALEHRNGRAKPGSGGLLRSIGRLFGKK